VDFLDFSLVTFFVAMTKKVTEKMIFKNEQIEKLFARFVFGPRTGEMHASRF